MAQGVPIVASGDTGLESVSGWAFEENAGTPAKARVLLRDGNGGNVLVPIRLAAEQSVGENYRDPLIFPKGCYVEVLSGVIRGAIYGGG